MKASSAIPFVSPQLATLVAAAPVGDEWLHEVKFDGFRILCRVQNGQVNLFTRTGQDWTDRFAQVAEAAGRLKVKSALIDGEVAILRPDGTTSFQALQNQMKSSADGPLTYFAFDLLFLDGADLRQRSLEERKAVLRRVIEGAPTRKSAPRTRPAGGVIRYTDHLLGNGPAFFEQARLAGLEGIVSKRRGEAYHSGRDASWVKTKALKRQEFVVGGFTEPEGSRSGIGALLVGFFRDGALVYAGKVGTGFSNTVATDLRGRLDHLATDSSPFESRVLGAGRSIHWVQPRLVAEIAYGEMTADGKLRHPSFQGLREDKPVAEVVQESPRGAGAGAAAAAKVSGVRTSGEGHPRADAKTHQNPGPTHAARLSPSQVAGVTLSHPERLLDESAGATKRDLAEYYEAVGSLMLPHLVGRPLSLVRCPEGTAKKCFFMKHAAFTTPQLRRVIIQEKEDKGEYLIADSVAGLISLAQMSVLEIHTWNSVEETLEMPDRVVFDLDPGPRSPWTDVVEAALLVKDRVERIGCATFVKTTGGKGLHVVVPLKPTASWDECKTFSQLVSESMVAEHPKRFTTAMRKAGREDKVLIDYFRNNRGSTSVAAYSTRALPALPVSWPVPWNQIASFSPDRPFTLSSALRLVREGVQNPWSRYESSRVDLKDVIRKGGRTSPKRDPASGTVRTPTSRAPAVGGGPDAGAALIPLAEYHKKRRFDVTAEPKGKAAPAARRRKKLAFVVQKHRATALHYDLRLEWKGVMLSWAVPRGPSVDPSVKRMAIQVEDHPIEYNKFEGIIPEGEYGGGTVMIWERGFWTPESADVDEALRKGELKLTLEGEKLHGSWVMVRTRPRSPQARPAWLLIKHRDQWASTQDVAELAPRSVVSNRLLIEIARDEGGDMRKAADGDPPSVLEQILANPKLQAPPRKGRKKSVWHSNRGGS